jgi:hypothetical protein
MMLRIGNTYLRNIVVVIILAVLLFALVLGPFAGLDWLPPGKQHLDVSNVLYSLSPPVDLFLPIVVLAMLVAGIFITRLIPKHGWLVTAFFILNPFMYSRIMAGQLGVLVGYLLLPIFVYYLLEFFKKGNSSTAIKLALTFTGQVMLQQHFVVLNAIIAIVLFAILQPNKLSWRSVLILVLILVALNAFWLQDLANTVSFTSTITEQQAEFFAPHLTDNVPTIAKIIGMWGFWREGTYLTSYSALPLVLWYALLGVIVGTFLLGYGVMKDRRHANLFFILWAIGVVLAVGISHPLTAPIFNFLFVHVPFFAGFRDSHKFVALVALAYAFLCPVGVLWLAEKVKAQAKRFGKRAAAAAFYAIPALFVAAIILFTYPLIGLWGQVHPTTYPPSYEQTNNYLKEQNLTGYIVYLPYYDYLTYNWTLRASPDGRIANPINKLVEPVVITNPGPWGANTVQTEALGRCIEAKNQSCLEANDVQFVLADHCYADDKHQDYAWLDNNVRNDSCISIYELQNAHRVDRTTHVPLRFIIGTAISVLTLLCIVGYLAYGKNRRR